ncbi:hypothetical protein C8R44DRAFT_629896, partial [Mycena epipterygia]
HGRAYIRCIVILVAFLHTKHHVTFRACAIILVALNFIFASLPGNLLGGEQIPLTLTTIFSRLHLNDKFKTHPICHLCHKIFEPTSPPNTMCPDCNCAVYRPNTHGLLNHLFNSDPILGDEHSDFGQTVNGTPKVVAPIQVLSDGLREFFARPGMVSAVEGWKTQRTVAGELHSMQDASVWRTIKGPDNQLFFYGGDSDKELRIGVTFSLDWYRADNLIFNGMPPGPTEPTSPQLQNYLKIIVDDLLMLYDHGIIIYPDEYPQGI